MYLYFKNQDMQTILRLEFKNIFPNERKREILDYLKEIPKDILLKYIGFANHYPQPNFDNFFSNPEIKEEICYRVLKYCVEILCRKQRVQQTCCHIKRSQFKSH